MRTPTNPFIINGYEGDCYSCDKVKETNRLASKIENGNDVALIATRRMGKSGLILHYFSNVCELD